MTGSPVTASGKTDIKAVYERLDQLSQTVATTTATQGEQIKTVTENMGRLENVVSELASTIRQQAASVNAHITDIRTDQAKSSSVSGTIHTRALWSIAGVVVSVCTTMAIGGAGWVSAQLEPQRRDIQHNANLIQQHQKDGHPHTVIGQIKNVETAVEGLKAELRAAKGEMRLRDELSIYRRANSSSLKKLDGDTP